MSAARIIRKQGWTLHYTIGEVVCGPITEGEQVETSRGETFTITGGSPPHHSGSTGRVWVTDDTGNGTREYFPTVIGAKWVKDGEG